MGLLASAVGGGLLGALFASGRDSQDRAIDKVETQAVAASQLPDLAKKHVASYANQAAGRRSGGKTYGTMLTGASGVNDNMLSLGRNTLLGQ